MTISVEADLKDILNKIDQRLERLEDKFDGQKKDFDNKFDELKKEFNSKFDGLKKDFDNKFDELKKDLIDVKIKQENMDIRLTHLEKVIEKIESNQSQLIETIADLKGTKSLIIPLIVAVTTSLLTLLIRSIPNS